MAKNILLIEDDSGLRSEIQDLLEEYGYSVAAAGNGADALLLLRHGNPPDLIILDLMLPLMSGWELSTELGRDENLSKIPLIILSAIADRREAMLLRVDAQDCIRKPFRAEDLLAAVHRHLP